MLALRYVYGMLETLPLHSPSKLRFADLQHVWLLSCEWSIHSSLRSSCSVLASCLSCVCCCPSEWLSGVLFWSWIWARWSGLMWLFTLSEYCLGLGLCLCGCEHWSRVLSWLWKWFWWLWFCRKALQSSSNSESRGRPMSRCITRFSSHSSSFEKEGLKEPKTKSCDVRQSGLACSTLTKYFVG